MKPRVNSLRDGQQLWAIVEENIAGGELIVNLSGDLIRVRNESSKKLSPGQRVLLAVEKTRPLEFKLIERKRPRNFTLDVEI